MVLPWRPRQQAIELKLLPLGLLLLRELRGLAWHLVLRGLPCPVLKVLVLLGLIWHLVLQGLVLRGLMKHLALLALALVWALYLP